MWLLAGTTTSHLSASLLTASSAISISMYTTGLFLLGFVSVFNLVLIGLLLGMAIVPVLRVARLLLMGIMLISGIGRDGMMRLALTNALRFESFEFWLV